MKKIICLLLSLLLMMAVLTSCDLRAGIAELENLYFEMVGALLETSPESNEQTTPHPGVTNPEPEATTPGQEITPDEPKHLFADFSKEDKERIQALVGLVIPFIPNNEYYVEEYEDETGPYISFYTFGNTQAEFDAYRELFADYTYDGSEVDEYGDTWYYYSIGDIYVDMSFYLYEDEYVVSIFIYPMDESDEGENNPGESEIDYGTLTNPVSTSYAYDMCADLADGESSLSPFYIKGTVTAIGEVGKYYKNVYFTDGETEMLIYLDCQVE